VNSPQRKLTEAVKAVIATIVAKGPLVATGTAASPMMKQPAMMVKKSVMVFPVILIKTL
jgi:hypothetical protein